MKTTSIKKRIMILILAFASVVSAFLAFIGFGGKTEKVYAYDANNDNAAAQAVDNMKIENVGAYISVLTPYSIRFDFKIKTDEILSAESKIRTTYEDHKDDYWFGAGFGGYYIRYTTYLIRKEKLPGLLADGSNLQLDIYRAPRFTLTKGYYGHNINEDRFIYAGGEITPDYVSDAKTFKEGEYTEIRAAFTLDQADAKTEYYPIVVAKHDIITAGALGLSEYFWHRDIHLAGNARSVGGISQMALDGGAEDEFGILAGNVEAASEQVEDVTGTENVTDIIAAHNPDLTVRAGAELTGKNTLKWTCTFNASNYRYLEQSVSGITFNWVVLKHSLYKTPSAYASTRDYIYDLTVNAALRASEAGYELNGTKNVSEVTYDVPTGEESTYYIAIPYILVKTGVDGDGNITGAYIICDVLDNARSVNSLTEPETDIAYVFAYLTEMQDKPFAEYSEKAVTLEKRINWDTITPEELSELTEIPLDEKGNFSCLMSIVNYWKVEQVVGKENVYYVTATYTTIPLTLRNDKGETDSITVALVSFADIDGKNEYTKNVTSLKTPEGKAYFNATYEIEPEQLYGYFYCYSYESEYENPNWQIDAETYDGSIVYFTECTGKQYKVGVNDYTSGGAGTGAIIGATIGFFTGGIKGAVIGGVIGAVIGGTGGTILGRVMGVQEEGTTVYYYNEYGFLDCTNMLPNNFYETDKPEEKSPFDTILLILVILLELYLFIKLFYPMVSGLPLVLKIIVVLAVIALLGVADYYFYQWLLSGGGLFNGFKGCAVKS